jgi:hypothetical protein
MRGEEAIGELDENNGLFAKNGKMVDNNYLRRKK